MSARKRAAAKKTATPKQPRVVKPPKEPKVAAPKVEAPKAEMKGADLIPVRYIAKKASPEIDPVLKLEWEHGTTRNVTRQQAEYLVYWADVWQDARDPESIKAAPLKPAVWKPTFQQDEIDKAPVLMPLQSMDAKALQQYSVLSFNEHLPPDMPVEQMRTEIMRFMTRPI